MDGLVSDGEGEQEQQGLHDYVCDSDEIPAVNGDFVRIREFSLDSSVNSCPDDDDA